MTDHEIEVTALKRAVERLTDAIREEITRLETWADYSVKYGKSTHQVGPMRQRAAELRKVLMP